MLKRLAWLAILHKCIRAISPIIIFFFCFLYQHQSHVLSNIQCPMLSWQHNPWLHFFQHMAPRIQEKQFIKTFIPVFHCFLQTYFRVAFYMKRNATRNFTFKACLKFCSWENRRSNSKLRSENVSFNQWLCVLFIFFYLQT